MPAELGQRDSIYIYSEVGIRVHAIEAQPGRGVRTVLQRKLAGAEKIFGGEIAQSPIEIDKAIAKFALSENLTQSLQFQSATVMHFCPRTAEVSDDAAAFQL